LAHDWAAVALGVVGVATVEEVLAELVVGQAAVEEWQAGVRILWAVARCARSTYPDQVGGGCGRAGSRAEGALMPVEAFPGRFARGVAQAQRRQPAADGPLRTHDDADVAGRIGHQGEVAGAAHRGTSGRHRQHGRGVPWPDCAARARGAQARPRRDGRRASTRGRQGARTPASLHDQLRHDPVAGDPRRRPPAAALHRRRAPGAGNVRPVPRASAQNAIPGRRPAGLPGAVHALAAARV
jgi:hypothetical protein